MQIEINLCHIDSDRIIVKVQAWESGKSLGSALGEGTSIDIAEEKAMFKLNNRLSLLKDKEVNKAIDLEKIQKKVNHQTNSIGLSPNENIKEPSKKSNKDITSEAYLLSDIPDDWEKELAIIDTEITRLKWTKEDENIYIKNLLGYNNRNKVTQYRELKILMMSLKTLKIGDKGSITQETKEDLIIKSSIILNKLKWDSPKGRDFLKAKFSVSSRQDLNKIQLLEFNMLLSEELNNQKSIRNISE